MLEKQLRLLTIFNRTRSMSSFDRLNCLIDHNRMPRPRSFVSVHNFSKIDMLLRSHLLPTIVRYRVKKSRR